jgi:Na+-transporting methylmalonyl-CoA/oxaloacetate decarboxylase gamma subunit
MGVDWGFAGLVGSVGFGMVFILLGILAVVIALTGLVLDKISAARSETGDEEKGE